MTNTYCAFKEGNLLSLGPLVEVLVTVKCYLDQGGTEPILFYDLTDGRQWDFDFTGSLTEVLEKNTQRNEPKALGRGRPKLGIVSREITLLPRHWDWLEQQPGRASGTIRQLVDAAMESSKTNLKDRGRVAVRLLTGVGGHLPGFEEFCRQVNRENWSALAEMMTDWPEGVKTVLTRILNISPGGETSA